MNKRHFFCRLIPPRPTFVQDMTDDEKRLMNEHAHYTQEQYANGKIVLYGPVMAASGAFGVAILEVADEMEGRQLMENDPTVRAGLNRFELHPTQVAAARSKAA